MSSTYTPPPYSGGGGVYIYREGAPAQVDNVYPTFAGAYAAASLIKPGPIYFDPSLDSDLVIPAGSYNFDLIPFIGVPSAVSPTLTINDGVTITGNSFYADNLAIQSIGATAPWSRSSGQLVVVLNNAAGLASGAAPVIALISGAQLIIEIRSFCYLLSSVAAVITAAGGTQATLYANGTAASFYDNTGSGAGTFDPHNMLEGVTGDGAVYISPTAFP